MKKVPLVLAVLVLLGAACSKQPTATDNQQINSAGGNTTAATPTNQTNTTQTETATQVIWEPTGSGWLALGTPPDCPEPFVLEPPAHLALATSLLYPGQNRPDYKPHGGFRFDTVSNNAVTVVSPIDGKLIRGSRYLSGGEVQYTVDIVNSCGMMVRLGHLSELTPKFQSVTNLFPPPQEGDSRTTRVQPPIPVAVGEPVATKIGVTKPEPNVFFDLGLYDLRKKNNSSLDPAYAAEHNPELDQHALCWIDYLPEAQQTIVRALPAGDPKAGKSSDYCK